MSIGFRSPTVFRGDSNQLFSPVVRWLLGGAFIYLGLSKAAHPADFLKLLQQYEVFHPYLVLNLVASLLPWFEFFCGLLLLLGVGVRGTAAMLLVMMGSFTWAVLFHAFALQKTSGLPLCAISFDCGCGAGEELVCRKIAENLVLMSFSAALIFGRNSRFCLRYALF